MPDSLLTVRELAARLRISPQWVYDHCRRKQPLIPFVPVGRAVRFSWPEVEAWLKKTAEEQRERGRCA